MPKNCHSDCQFGISCIKIESEEIILTAIGDLHKNHDEYSPYLDKSMQLQKAVGLNVNFYYQIECMTVDKHAVEVLEYEKGVGHLEKVDNKIILKREFSLELKTLGEPPSSFPRHFYNFNAVKERPTYLRIRTSNPSKFEHLFPYENCVACSSSRLTANPVELQENTLLGRKDGIIQSIDKVELGEILEDQFIKGLESYKDPVVLSTKSLALNKDSELRTPKIIAIATSRPRKPIEGTILFNSSSKKLELFDGTGWRSLATET